MRIFRSNSEDGPPSKFLRSHAIQYVQGRAKIANPPLENTSKLDRHETQKIKIIRCLPGLIPALVAIVALTSSCAPRSSQRRRFAPHRFLAACFPPSGRFQRRQAGRNGTDPAPVVDGDAGYPDGRAGQIIALRGSPG
jgi:hypothetical protein